MTTLSANASRFSCAIKGTTGEIRVTACQGQSFISGLYQYDIGIASKSPNIDLKKWLDQPVTLTLHGETDRHIQGLIMQARTTGQGREFTDYRITIVPRLWRLTQSNNHRIFQNKSANQIITLILQEHGIVGDGVEDHTAEGQSRNYCVQFGESDFAFVTRLMHEEGWHFHFLHHKDRHILRLADKNTAFSVKTGPAQIRYEQETSRPQDVECIHALNARHSLTTGAVRLGDFNFEKPGLSLRELNSGHTPARELYDHPGLFSEPVQARKTAALRLQQAEALRQLSRMETHATTFEAGQWFQLTDHPNPAFNQKYLVISSSLSGSQPQSYGEGAASMPAHFRCELECIPWTTEFRPPHKFRKPSIKGPHSAVVTGPGGEEIYTDGHGRVKVQFHWDREARGDQNTSCWLRVNQPVAGMQWGGIAIPRIGQEVIVEFEHGDPDRPLMVGRVYNGQNLPPYALPEHKTRSTLKTLSSPGGNGYNEVRIEDKKSAEQILLRAEKDIELRVKNSAKSEILHDMHRTIGNEDFREFNQDWHQAVDGAVNEKTGQNLSLTIGQDMHLKVSGVHVLQTGNAIHIKAGAKAVIQGGVSLSVKGGAGFITLDASGVSIMGPLVRINEGGGGGSAQSANPTQPGSPAEADSAVPGARLQAATGPITPVPEVIDFDKAQAQLATLRLANTFNSPLAEDCPECKLFAERQAVAEPQSAPPAPSTPAPSSLSAPVAEAAFPWEAAIWADTPWYEKAIVSTGFVFDALNKKLSAVAEWPAETVATFDTIGADPNTPEALRFAVAALKVPARIGTGLVGGTAATAGLVTNPESRAQLAAGIKTLYDNPEILADAAQKFADKPAYEQASDVIVLASEVTLGNEIGKAVKMGKQAGKVDELPPGKKPAKKEMDLAISKKKVAPGSLTEAKNMLAKRREEIAANGYQPKYSDAELAHMAQHGDVGAERFQVRFMETTHLVSQEAPTEHLSGAMGRTMEGSSGNGAKYWSTSFDQLVDKDSDPKLIAESLGLEYNPKAHYTLIITDTEKAAPLTGVKSVPATFEKVGEFANKELPKQFPKHFTDKAMTPEFQAEYAKQYQAAVDQKFLKDKWSKDTAGFEDYLKTTEMKQADIADMKLRMEMHDKIGNNQDYVGNGLTKDMNPGSPNEYGTVETLNFERKEVNLRQLNDADAISILPGLKPL